MEDTASVSISTENLLNIAQTFPSTPQILAELGLLLRNPNVEMADVALQLKRDPTLAARLIRLANSVAFAQTEPVAAIETAVRLAGFQEVHRLVGVAMLDQFGDEGLTAYGITSRRMRENALFTALLMEELAKPADEDPRTAYTIGLLRSIGKVALDRLARGHAPGERYAALPEPVGVAEWEKSIFGLTNTEAAATIMKAWRFPSETAKAIGEHYAPAGRHLPLTHLLNLAANMADKIGYGLPGETGYWLETDEVYRKAGVKMRDAKPYIDRAHFAFDRLQRSNF
jgi:HD-like signal output (HDOD) protein